MRAKQYDIPPLTMLRAFEAASRRGAFNEAASELNVTPGAVSHQVKALEKWLGMALFSRGHRAVTLTDEGERLFAVLRDSFRDIAAITSSLRMQAETPRVEVLATTAVSSLWLTQRVISFGVENEDIQVNQQVSDSTMERPLTVDLAIEYRLEPPKEPKFVKLFDDELVPVCTPEMAERLKDASLEELSQQALINMDARNENWTTWATWFDMMGYMGPVAMARRVNNYSIAIQLAREGAGIALGWRKLTSVMIEDGRLATLEKHFCPSPGAFYLISPLPELAEPTAKLFNWMVEHHVK
ncbi:LysR family transcriptional regulator [Amylibacter sp. IMCC11727]|uniref:LysR family transcriptional regulator n=1 Tax=Amylibacter sp. IMCC11727 TaxID=3039851 RepID=UPI00244E5BA2|nr:LysR family transcriptional regulator [Amylibacter sp. IMCC11727]WGI20262.1 LysR family transcriptional regulator [Amylibacter sp. IMCC11727]